MRLRLPVDQHQPQTLDVETHRDHVGRDRAVHPLPSVMERAPETPSRLGDLVGAHPRGQLDHVGEAGAIPKEALRFAEPNALAVPLERVLHLLFEDSPRAPELAQAVEVGQDSHVRVGRIVPVAGAAGLAPSPLRRAHEGEQDPAHRLLRVATLGSNAEVPACVLLGCGHGAGEPGVPTLRPRRREHVCDGPREERLNLLPGVADGGGRGNDLRPYALSPNLPRAQRFDHRLVEPGHSAERAGNQVQLILNDEIGWQKRARKAVALAGLRRPVEPGRVIPVGAAEKRAGHPDPRQRSELVHGGDEERGQAPVRAARPPRRWGADGRRRTRTAN